MKKLLIIVVSFVLYSQAPAQIWTTYTVAKTAGGLADNSPTCIAVDQQNNKWIGTYSGVSKFDGNSWTVYNTTNSKIVSNNISCIAIDNQGKVWVATSDSGVSVFNGSIWTTYNTTNSSIPSNQINKMVIDKQNRVWFTFSDYYDSVNYIFIGMGAAMFEGSTWTLFTKSNSSIVSDRVQPMAVDTFGNVWVGSNDGVSKYDGVNWTTHTMVYSGVEYGIVRFIDSDPQGGIWVGESKEYHNALSKFNGTSWVSFPVPTSFSYTYSSVIGTSNGDFWFGGNNGVSMFNGGDWNDATDWINYSTGNSGIVNDNIIDIAIDKNSDKWFITSYGISVLSNSSTSVNEYGVNSVKTFPNPFNTQTTIQFNQPVENTSLKLADISGREIKVLNFSGKQCVLERGDLTSGIYFLSVVSENKIIATEKLVIQ